MLRSALAAATLALALLLARPAQAADAVGVWVFDQAAMRAQAARLADAMLKRLPPDPQKSMAAQADAMEAQAAALRKDAGTDPQAQESVRQLEDSAAEMRAVAADPRAYFRQQFGRVASNPTASLELRRGGAAVTTMDLGGEQKAEAGHWQARDRTVTVEFAGSDETVRAAGPLSGDHLQLRVVPAPGDDSADDEIARAYTLYLVRR